MARKWTTLGETLRAILLSTPFLGGVACGSTGTADLGSAVGNCSLPNGGVRLEVPQEGFLLGDCMPYCWPAAGARTCEIVYTDPRYFCCCCGGGSCCNTGRRPVSLLPRAPRPQASVLGSYFREASRLEAASVEAFRLFGLESRAHGAPEKLWGRARGAARDEIRHARLTGALARRFAAEPERPRYGAMPEVRSLEAFALENAVEGCVRETYGALVGLWQAKHAGDAKIAHVMRRIADDEVRHAELSWAVANWAEPLLSRQARARVADARANAFEDLESEAGARVPSQLVAIAGLPSAEMGQSLVRFVRATVSRA
jgi:hypothetical protein